MATYDLGTIGYTVQNTGAPKSIAELKEFAQAGLEAHRNSTQLSQSNRLAQYFATIDKQITQVNRNMQNHNRYLAQAEQGSNRFGVVTQQAGYQIGDFLVQVQSGTNWMVAFGQQATQLVGILPLMGAGFMGLSAGALVALSAGLGIAIPLVTAIGAAWMRTSEEIQEGADKQKQAYESVTQALENLRLERQMEVSGAATTSEQTLLNEIVAIQAERRVIAAEILELESQANSEYSLMAATERGRLATKDNELRLTEQRNQLILDEINAERQIAEEAERAERAVVSAYEAYASTRMEAEQVAEQVRLIEGGMSQAAVDALRFAGVDLASGVSSAAREAAILAANMGMSLNAAISFMNMQSGMTYGQVGARSDPRDFLPGGSKYQNEGFKPFVYTPPKSGGGGRSSQLKKEIELTKELTQAEKDRQTILRSVEGSLENGFMAMVDGTKSVKDAFKSMAAEIIKELYRVLVVQRLVGAISGGIGMFSGSSTGSLGLPFGLATGGSMMANRPYLVGEHGPELVIPRHSGTVVNANQTSGAMSNGGSVVVNNNFSISANGDESVKQIIRQQIPNIAEATKAAVADSKLRGGAYGRAFR